MSETLEETGVDDAAETAAEVGAATEVEGAAETTAETPAPAAEPTTGFDRNNIEHLQAAAQALAELGYEVRAIEQQPQPQAPDPAETLGLDQNDIAALKQALGVDRFEQIIAWQEQQARESFVSGAMQAVIDGSEVKDIDPGYVRQLATHIANTDPTIARYGATVQGVQAATQKALEVIAARDKAAGEAAVEAYKAGLSADGSTLLDPAVRGSAIEGTQQPVDELDAARRYAFNR